MHMDIAGVLYVSELNEEKRSEGGEGKNPAARGNDLRFTLHLVHID